MPRSSRPTRLALSPLEDRTTPTAGTVDPSFGGGDGVVAFNLPGYYGVDSRGVAPQPDGKTVLVGVADSPGGKQAAVYRLNADGSLDTGFSGDGVVTSLYGGGEANFEAVALQPDGKAVATGSVRIAGQTSVLLARFNTDGTPDGTFGSGGFARTDFSSFHEAGYGLALQPDGKIVVVGDAGGFMILRYTTTGTLDTSFDLDGTFRHQPGGYGAWGRGVTLQPDGKIVAVGGGVPGGSPEKGFLLIRLNPNGTPDTSFHGDGLAHLRIPGAGDSSGNDVAVLPDGRIIAVGATTYDSFGQHAAARFLPNGSLDTTFDQDGSVMILYPDNPGGELWGVAVGPDGKAVAAGYVVFPGYAVVMRFNEDGSTDPTFGVGNQLLAPGVVYSHVGGASVSAHDVTFAPDGRIVTAGKADGYVAAFRYLGEATAVRDQYAVTEDTPRLVAAPGVLANDALPANGNPQSILVQGPAHAADFTLNADGSFSYTPAANYHGTDSFTYQVVDGELTTNTTTVTLTVQAVNDAPTSAANAYQYRFRSPLAVSAASGVLNNDADPDGDPLRAVLIDQPAQGIVFLNDDGSFTFTYPDGLTDTLTFTYKATDGTADGPVTTVTLARAPNAPPVAAADAYQLPLFGSITVPAAEGVLKNDTDADANAITAELVSGPTAGALDLRADGSFTYSFPPDVVGAVTFTYRATDGVDPGDPVTVTLTRERMVVAREDGLLVIVGTGEADAVRIRPAGGRTLRVTFQTPAGLTSEVVNPGRRPFHGIVVYLGAGNDRLDLIAGRILTTVVGGAGDDVLWTGAGDDALSGDDLAGSPGNDVIDAGGGRNSINAGGGDNMIRTGAGPDYIEAGNGRNQIDSGAGNDSISGGTGGSVIDAGAGNDLVVLLGGSNWVDGGLGNDVLVGGFGADRLFGGAGRDMLQGGFGADLLDGGAGSDILFEGDAIPVSGGLWADLVPILARYKSTSPAVLADIRSRLSVFRDDFNVDTLTGGGGVDWLWSEDGLDVLDATGAEPRN